MLFSVDDNTLFKEYFNLDTKRNDFLSPKEGLILGNMFFSMYEPYKNYKPRELVAKSEKDRKLLKIRELAFAINDLNLFLDLNPSNMDAYNKFKMYVKELDECVNNYSKEYDSLELCKDLKERYTWYKGPWPWEVDKDV